MASSTYVPPGVYIQQKVQPGSVTVSAERVLGIVGIAPRTRRSTDEAVIRGKVYEETLTFSVAPHLATLANISNRDRNNAVLRKNDQVLSLGLWSFSPAKLVATTTGAATINTQGPPVLNKLSISLDGKDFVTISCTSGAAVPLTTIATDFNAALAALSAYGSAYNSVFSVTGTGATSAMNITSPLSTSASSVKLVMSPLTNPAGVATDICSILAGGGVWTGVAAGHTATVTTLLGVEAASVVLLNATAYSATATYKIDYVTVETYTDPLTNAVTATPLSDLISVGSYPGLVSFTEDVDFEDNGNLVDWAVAGQVQSNVTSLDCTGCAAFAVGVNDTIKLSINGNTPISVTFAAPAAVDATTVANKINSILAASSDYGPEFSFVATVVSVSYVKLTAPSQFVNFPVSKGAASSIVFYDVTGNGLLNLFGIATASLPYEVFGIGSRPSFGSAYYVTYDFTRSADDYANPTRVYSTDQLYDFTSPITQSNYSVNKLAIAGEIAFENGASSLFLIQINDSTAPGTPTYNQISDAIDAAALSSLITDVVVAEIPATEDTAEAVHVKLMGHVASMCSQTEKKYRRGWFGMPRGTSIGDPDSPHTFIFTSTRVLQPNSTSPARGRLILCAPAEIDRIITLEDSSEQQLELDGSFLAVANAAAFCALPSPADALLGKTITGFVTDSTFETYLSAEFNVMADNGVFVNVLDAGNIKMVDPLTTEAGGSGVVEFEEPSSSAQKDAVTRSVDSVLDKNCKGVVPDDLTDFLADIKGWIGSAINSNINAGNIGPYRTINGTTRSIDLLSDIQVFQDATDPRTYTFKYWFNLRYVAKRFFGEYSVDNPFFA